MRSFRDLSTSTKGKIDYDSNLSSVIPVFSPSHPYVLTLFGAADGCARQMKLFLDKGYPASNIIVVEREELTYLGLKRVKKDYGFELVHGDFLETLVSLIKSGYSFGFVDFDATCQIGPYVYNLMDVCSHFKNHVMDVHLVMSTQVSHSNKEYDLEMQVALGINHRRMTRRRYIPKAQRNASDIPNSRNEVYKVTTNSCPPKYTLINYCQQELGMKVIRNDTYKGRCPMHGLIFSNHRRK